MYPTFCPLNSGPAAELDRSCRQIVIEERRVVDPISATEDDVANAAKEFCGSVGKAHMRPEIFKICPPLHGDRRINQRAREPAGGRVGYIQIQVGLRGMRFVPRSVN